MLKSHLKPLDISDAEPLVTAVGDQADREEAVVPPSNPRTQGLFFTLQLCMY